MRLYGSPGRPGHESSGSTSGRASQMNRAAEGGTRPASGLPACRHSPSGGLSNRNGSDSGLPWRLGGRFPFPDRQQRLGLPSDRNGSESQSSPSFNTLRRPGAVSAGHYAQKDGRLSRDSNHGGLRTRKTPGPLREDCHFSADCAHVRPPLEATGTGPNNSPELDHRAGLLVRCLTRPTGRVVPAQGRFPTRRTGASPGALNFVRQSSHGRSRPW